MFRKQDPQPTTDNVQIPPSVKPASPKVEKIPVKRKSLGVQQKSMGEVPLSVAQSAPRGLGIGPSTAQEVFELEAPLASELEAPSVFAPIPSLSPTIARELASNRGRHAPIPLGSPAELPAYPTYMQLAQNQGPRPQSSLRQFLVVQNLVPAEMAELGTHSSLERSVTVGSPGYSSGMVRSGALTRQMSAPAGSGAYAPAGVAGRMSKGTSAPGGKATAPSGGWVQAPAGIAELSSSPKLKKTKAVQGQMQGIQESSRGIEISGPPPYIAPKPKKTTVKDTTKAVSMPTEGAGGSKPKASIPKVKTERSPALDAMLRKREVQDTANAPPKAPKATKAKDEKPKEAKAQDLSRGLGGPATPKPTASSSKPHLKEHAPTPAASKPAKHAAEAAHIHAKGPTAVSKEPKAPKVVKQIYMTKPSNGIHNPLTPITGSKGAPRCPSTPRCKTSACRSTSCSQTSPRRNISCS